MLDGGTYYLYYNAKTDVLPAEEGGGWREQTGVATSKDLKSWTRYEKNPILRNGPRGSATYPAVNPIASTQPPTPDARDSRFASNPFVVQNGRGIVRHVLLRLPLSTAGPGLRDAGPGRQSLHFHKVPEILIAPALPAPSTKPLPTSLPSLPTEGVLYHFYCAVSGQYPQTRCGARCGRSKPW